MDDVWDQPEGLGKMTFTNDGIIGRSGCWYTCEQYEHTQTMLEHKNDAPFVQLKMGTDVTFDAYYTADKIKPNKLQFETLMNWCTTMKKRFEDVTDCWNLPWEDYQ